MCHSCRKLQLSAHLVNIQLEIASDNETLPSFLRALDGGNV